MKSFAEEYRDIQELCTSANVLNNIRTTRKLLINKPLVLYGAGAVGISAARVLKNYGITAGCFCDKNKTGEESATGLLIISPNELRENYYDANVVICSVNYYEGIKSDLKNMGFPETQIFSRDFLNLHEMTLEDLKTHLPGYEWAYNMFADEESKEVLMERIKCLLLSSSTLISPNIQYFDSEIVTVSAEEIFVDGGMYTGDTFESFYNFTSGIYKTYYGFEPDLTNFKTAMKNLDSYKNVNIHNKGLWSCETELCFDGNLTSSSKLAQHGDNLVAVTSLDEFFRDKEPPTFIKMDIEGAEPEALNGCRQIIRLNKPKLAICVYHKPEDIYTIPDIIQSYRKDYKFYLRHYTQSIYETVLYAI